MNGAMKHTVTTSYDTHGRRATKKVTTNGSITLHQRYIYRGYLQLAYCDLTRTGHPCLWLLTWDPTQPVATRPLAIRKDGTWYAYGWDLTKNICEIFGQHGYLRTAYSYSPYGEVTADGDVTQPIQWSSEYNDTELALVYYNYRHYNPLAGRWIGRDRLGEKDASLLYKMVDNNTIYNMDVIGNADYTRIACCVIAATLSIWKSYDTLSGEVCVGETGSDYVKCMLANTVASALGASTLSTVSCCVLRNMEKGDVSGARQCVQDEIDGIIRDFLHITALTCCLGPNTLLGIGRTIIDDALQSVKNTSPKPCCP